MKGVQFNDPSEWDDASYNLHPMEVLKPLPDRSSEYRQPAIASVRLLSAIDQFMNENGTAARASWIGIACVFNLNSVRT